jgi:sulfur relay protein TusD/DsrE
MRFNLLILGKVYSSQSAYSAWRFATAAVADGHQISQVFFYQDAVHQGSQLLNPLADEFNPVSAWQNFAKENDTDLVVCTAAAERRGVIDNALAAELEQLSGNLSPAFRITGLGAWQQACLENERSVSFR